jgi:CRP-like cAMP-binding protein
MDEKLKKLLYDEGRYKMPDEVLDRFVGMMTEVRLKNRQALMPYGKFDSNVYVLKSGIIRYCYFDGEKEKTYGFTTPGTVMISYHSNIMNQPSFFQVESCGESVVMKVSREQVDELVAESHEFARWMLSIQSMQLYFFEFKHAAINGLAKERYLSLIKNRPEVATRVPLKTIASYLGVSPNYLSRVKGTLPKGK